MHIVVCMKQVPDLQQLRIRPETREPVLDGLPMQLGDFGKNALEAAVQFKEADESIKITVLSAGPAKLKDTIKEALAMGADEAAILTAPDLQSPDAAGAARLLAAAIQKMGGADLVLLGEGSADEYTGQMPSRLAELLGMPQAVYVKELALAGDGKVKAGQDFEDEVVTVEMTLPALVSVTSELNEPRLPPLTAILKAGSKPLHEWTADDLGVTAADVGAESATLDTRSNLAPEQARKNVLYEDVEEGVAEVVKALRHEGVIG